ncbi:hypothetical protein QL285_091098 [Trifolium repens]|nr:hypothetical protein QL285_091098 [Trifolium repens]
MLGFLSLTWEWAEETYHGPISPFLRLPSVNDSLSSCRFFHSVSPFHHERFAFINASSIQFASPNHPSKASLSYLLPLVLLAFEFRDIDVSSPTSTQSGTNVL